MIKRGWKYLTEDHANVLEKLCKEGNAEAINTYGKECEYIGTSNGRLYGMLIGVGSYIAIDALVAMYKIWRDKVKLKKAIEEFAKLHNVENEQNT